MPGPPGPADARGVLTEDLRQRLLTRPMALVLVLAFGAFCGFYLLLSVVPLYASASGVVSAGLSTGALMLATVAIEPAVPRLAARLGYRAVLALGVVLLGAPAFALTLSPAMPLVLAVALARGAGLGIVVVVAVALVAELAAPERRGEALGLYGIAVGVPPIAALPLGVWLSAEIGYGPLFVAGALLPLVTLPAVLGLPSRRPPVPSRSDSGPAGLLRPTLIFGATTFAAGVFVTFLPLAVPPEARPVAAVALLVQSAVTPLARWVAGRFGDRFGSGRLLIPSVLLAAIGTAATVVLDRPVAVIAGMAVFGVGFGMAQNVTLAVMFDRVPEAAFGRVSVLWNIAYDAGLGAGAVGFGLVVGGTGYPVAFAATAALLFAALLPAWRDQRKGQLR
ncbi:MFS transporter [Amycolatopsis sp. 195334CR]|nr:MFS transporter [Amycolatopsis sp. 195334CR]